MYQSVDVDEILRVAPIRRELQRLGTDEPSNEDLRVVDAEIKEFLTRDFRAECEEAKPTISWGRLYFTLPMGIIVRVLGQNIDRWREILKQFDDVRDENHGYVNVYLDMSLSEYEVVLKAAEVPAQSWLSRSVNGFLHMLFGE